MNKVLYFVAIALWLLLLAPPPVEEAYGQGGGIPRCNTLTNTANNSQCASTAFVQNMLGNTTTSDVATGAWTQWTPTIAGVSCSLTTASGIGRYKIIGNKTLIFQIVVNLTSIGTCTANFITASLPPGVNLPNTAINTGAPVTQFGIGQGREVAVNGMTIQAFYYPPFGSSNMSFGQYNAAAITPTNGWELTITGSYETL